MVGARAAVALVATAADPVPSRVLEKRPKEAEDGRLVIEVVDEAARIDAVLPMLDEMVADGLVTLERVEVVQYRANKEH